MLNFKKHLAIIIFLALVISLSSCDLFKCKHKEYSEKVVEPNCFAEGYTEHTCTKCEESYRDNYTPKTHHYFVGEACPNCGMEEITDNITPDTEWYSEEIVVFDLATKEQLAGLASLVNSGTDFSGVKVYLDADIDLGYYEWIPIGNADHAFNGTFDGDGHTISGLKINANSAFVGLFGKSSGKICNLNIVDANVYVKRDSDCASIVCGYLTNEISDVNVDGFIEAPKTNGVGAIAGAAEPVAAVYKNLSNNAKIKGQNSVGGIFGHIKATGIIQTENLTNTGDVTGVMQVGGIVGYAKANNGSKIYKASVSADIVGEYAVGGILGRTDTVAVSTCTNDGSTITVNSYDTDGTNFFAWLGGYVGDGYGVDNCVNNVDITYNARGIYVGGIIGFARNNINNCTNNGDITTNTNCVGGIAGEVNSPTLRYLSDLINTGNVSGYSRVGGTMGCIWNFGNQKGNCQWYYNEQRGTHYGDPYYYHHYYESSIITNLSNIGNVSAVGEVGGIIGYVNVQNSFMPKAGYNCDASCHPCYDPVDFRLEASNLVNKGNLSGQVNCGEMFGYFYCDLATNSTLSSVINSYTVTGKITFNGEVKEGIYDVGSNTKLTLSGREVYTDEDTEATK